MAKKVGPGSIFKGSSRFSKKGNSSTTSNKKTVAGSSSAFGGTRGFGQTSPPPQATTSAQSDNTSDSPFSGDDSFGATDAFGSSNPQNERSQSTSVPIDDSPFGSASANQSSAFGQTSDSNLGGTIYTSNPTSSAQRVSPVGEIPQATAAVNSEKDDARVFLRRSDVEMKRNSIFSWLIGIFKLDVYGTQNLTRRALFSMQMASLILLVIFIFDLALWFVLFNLILNSGGDPTTLTGMSSLAALLALCMATVSIIFEASIFNSDLSSINWKNGLALGGRVLLILIAARVTAEPFHVLVFEEPIVERDRIEQGIEQGLFVATILQENDNQTLSAKICGQENTSASNQNKKTLTEQGVLVASSQKTNKQKELKKKVEKLEQAKKNVGWAKKPLSNKYGCRYQKINHKDETKRKTKREAEAHCNKRKTHWENQVSSLTEDVGELQGQITNLDSNLSLAETSDNKAQTRLDYQDKVKDQCAVKVGEMEDWLEDGLKGYAADLLSTSKMSNFTLSNCIDNNLNSSGKQPSLQIQIKNKIAADLSDSLTLIEVEKQTKLAEPDVDSQFIIDSIEAQKDAVKTLSKRKQNLCERWIFSYKEPGFWTRKEALEHHIWGELYHWPAKSYSQEDCRIMLDVLKIPAPHDGSCAKYTFDNDSAALTKKDSTKDYINAVTVTNTSRTGGVEFVAEDPDQGLTGDTLSCDVRLKTPCSDGMSPDQATCTAAGKTWSAQKNVQYEITWIHNGVLQGSAGIFQQNNPKMDSAATLPLSKHYHKDDTISCQVTPITPEGTYGKEMEASFIKITDGQPPLDLQTDEELADEAFSIRMVYYLVTFIGMFIPLVSLLFKMVAPEDLKEYYSVKYQGSAPPKSLSKLYQGIRDRFQSTPSVSPSDRTPLNIPQTAVRGMYGEPETPPDEDQSFGVPVQPYQQPSRNQSRGSSKKAQSRNAPTPSRNQTRGYNRNAQSRSDHPPSRNQSRNAYNRNAQSRNPQTSNPGRTSGNQQTSQNNQSNQSSPYSGSAPRYSRFARNNTASSPQSSTTPQDTQNPKGRRKGPPTQIK